MPLKATPHSEYNPNTIRKVHASLQVLLKWFKLTIEKTENGSF